MIPAITMPNMATLITGAPPGDTGVVNNTRCYRDQRPDSPYLFSARDLKSDTLWQAADRAGLRTANVAWTTTVGAAIDYNLPQVWDVAPDAQFQAQARQSTPGLLARVDPEGAQAQGPYRMDDARRATYARRIIDLYGPDLVTVFFGSFDDAQHASGVDTPQARHALESIDTLIGEVVASERRRHPDAAVVIVSDHGFSEVTTEINLYRAFADAGLLSLDHGVVRPLVARPCVATGTTFVLLAHPKDSKARARVAAVLARLSADPANGIDRVLTRPAIRARGGWKDADFMIVFHPGFMAAFNPSAPLRATSHYHGMHGYWPDDPKMYATFILQAPNNPLAANLGVIGMRRIAPTIAKLLGVHLRTAKARPLF